jgi:integral membrane sensor domain MASE1
MSKFVAKKSNAKFAQLPRANALNARNDKASPGVRFLQGGLASRQDLPVKTFVHSSPKSVACAPKSMNYAPESMERTVEPPAQSGTTTSGTSAEIRQALPAGFVADLLLIVAFAIVLVVVQRFTFLFRFPPCDRTAIWLPGSLIFGVLLLSPASRWWRIYLAMCLAAAAAFWSDSAVGLWAALFGGQLFFASLAVSVLSLRRFGAQPFIESPLSLLLFMLLAGLVVPTVSNFSTAWLFHDFNAGEFLPVTIRRNLGSTLGLILGTPAIYFGWQNRRDWLNATQRWRWAEAALLGGVLLVVCYLVFIQPSADIATKPALLYAPLPLLMWGAWRRGHCFRPSAQHCFRMRKTAASGRFRG